MNDPRPVPRILLVEDEPTSAAFLAAATRALPAQVDIAGTVAAALTMTGNQAYDLWLFDATLPDGSGEALLMHLQERFPDVPAIAHTASDDPLQLAALGRAGFREVLRKPLPGPAVQAAVRRVLGLPPAQAAISTTSDAPRCWDDEAAARALNGNALHVATLRGLFLAELPQARQRIGEAVAVGDADAVGAELHRLRASCGFVGAARLDALVQALQRAPLDQTLFAAFAQAAQATLDAPPEPGATPRYPAGG
ncbi:MAG: response regulator [Lysobacter sp.]